MPKKFRDAHKELSDAGYQPARQNGSHITYKNASGKTVTVPKHKEIKTGTWSSIAKAAGLKKSRPLRTPDAEQVQRLANDGVARAGTGPAAAQPGQQGEQTGQQTGQHAGRKSERTSGGRG